MGLKRTSRRRFGKALVVGTAATGMASTAASQEKPAELKTPPPCIVNPALGEFELPRSAEPAFTFRA